MTDKHFESSNLKETVYIKHVKPLFKKMSKIPLVNNVVSLQVTLFFPVHFYRHTNDMER